MALTDQQRRFCEGVVGGSAPVDAYVAAGYKTSGHSAAVNASRLLKRPDIVEHIEGLRAKAVAAAEEKTGVSVSWVLERLKQNVERAMQAEPVYDDEGNQTGVYRYAGAVANRALELLGKHLGMFDAKEDDEGEIDTEQLTALFKAMVRSTRGGSQAP